MTPLKLISLTVFFTLSPMLSSAGLATEVLSKTTRNTVTNQVCVAIVSQKYTARQIIDATTRMVALNSKLTYLKASDYTMGGFADGYINAVTSNINEDNKFLENREVRNIVQAALNRARKTGCK